MNRLQANLKSFLIIFSFIYFSSISLSIARRNPNYGNILFSTVVFRHGERTPSDIFPLDPYNESYWPQGLQQLTNDGKMKMYQLGRWYRQRYINILEKGYNSDTIYLRSSDEDRTIMSAECFLAGLYHPSGPEIWNPQLLWQPIPVHSISSEVDNIFSLRKPCDRLDYLLEETNKDPLYVQYYKEKEPLFNYLSELTGYTFTVDEITGSLMNAVLILDTLNLQAKYNLSTPSWFTLSLASELDEIGMTAFLSHYMTNELIKFQTGVLLGAIVNNMIEKRNGILQTERKIEIYSGRFENILGLAVGVGAYDEKIDFIDTSIMVELRKHIDDYNVEVLLHFANSSEPTSLKMERCPSPCSLDQFIVAVEEYIIYDWDKECEMSTINVFLITIGLVVVLVILFAYGTYRKIS